MRIPRVHVDNALAVGAEIALPQAQSHYLKHVLRLKPGAALRLFNGLEDCDYEAVLSADGKSLGARIGAAQPVHNESPLHSEVLQGLGRADHMDWMVQKTTELGINRIHLFNATRTQSPLKAKPLDKKMAHWRGVAISACEQCGRARLPEISFHLDLQSAIDACGGKQRLLLDFSGAALLDCLQEKPQSVSLLLGPEGGLDPGEIDIAGQSRFLSVRLGPRVLRTETAAVSALALVQAYAGDLG